MQENQVISTTLQAYSRKCLIALRKVAVTKISQKQAIATFHLLRVPIHVPASSAAASPFLSMERPHGAGLSDMPTAVLNGSTPLSPGGPDPYDQFSRRALEPARKGREGRA
jgi:hypothetical protein